MVLLFILSIIFFISGLLLGRRSARKKIHELEHSNDELYQEYLKLVKDVFGEVRKG